MQLAHFQVAVTHSDFFENILPQTLDILDFVLSLLKDKSIRLFIG